MSPLSVVFAQSLKAMLRMQFLTTSMNRASLPPTESVTSVVFASR